MTSALSPSLSRDDFFAQHLQTAVRLAGDVLGSGIVESRERRRLVTVRREGFGIDRDRGDEREQTRSVAERVEQFSHLTRHVRASVDGRVPRPVRQPVQVMVTIAKNVLTPGEQINACLPPVEQRHVVTAADRDLRHVTTDELGTSDDQDAHGPTVGVRELVGDLDGGTRCGAVPVGGSRRWSRLAAVALSVLAAPGALAAQPDPVTNLHAVPAHQQVTLSWTLPAGNVNSVLIRRAAGDTPPSRHQRWPAGIRRPWYSNFIDTSVQDGTTYSYSVWAVFDGPTFSDPKQVTVTPIPRAPMNLELSASARQVTFGKPVTFSAKATTQNGKPARDEEVQLESRDSGASHWRSVDSVNTDQQGRATWSIRPQRNADYRVSHDATAVLRRREQRDQVD